MAAIGGEALAITIAIAVITSIAIIVSNLYLRSRRRRCSELADKPQNHFKRVLADNSYSHFKHFQPQGKDREISLKVHPFVEEITSLLDNPPSFTTLIASQGCPQMSSTYTWIDTEAQLESLAKQLSSEKIFAVDTEQHSLRSYLGFTALMQISTHNEDYLIDTIALHDKMGLLRSVFADPSICKVFHGSDNDVLWLQRDFHIYIVNMFDTAKACEVLTKPQKSLAYLLETYCKVSTDKSLQLEDWRVRPLSNAMIEYARADAHYLLYIADCLASELQLKTTDTSASCDDKLNFLYEASRRSNMICMQLYAKEVESVPGASAATSFLLRNQNVEVVKSSEAKDLIWILCAWRDLMARIHDESLRYVLSDQAIVALAVKVPNTPEGVYSAISEADLSNSSSNASCSTAHTPSPIVSNHLEEISSLLEQTDADIYDIFSGLIQKHLGPSGCSPLSAHNYALLLKSCLKQTGAFSLRQTTDKFNSSVNKKTSRENFVQKFSCKAPVYHNCRIYASDGRLLCYCDRKKIEWYLQRDLAKLVEDKPPAIMLLFEPKGRPEDEDNEFYIQSKKNMCVGCGEKNHYLRYRIIPSCYRMHFPEHLKSHRSHDIVLLCVDCHEIAHSAAEKYKRKVAKEFGIPLFVQKIVNSGESAIATITSESETGVDRTGVSPLQLRTAAMALLRHGSSMPSQRVEELMQIVKIYFGKSEISTEDLEIALLVGMSPQEKRRLERKRGLSFSHSEQSIIYKNSLSIAEKTTEGNRKEHHTTIIKNDRFMDSGRECNSTSSQTFAYLMKDEEGSPISISIQRLNEKEVNNEDLGFLDGDDDSENLTNGVAERECRLTSDDALSFRAAKKLSLLGHGPHGKQVVEYLLNKYGEDGISEFCQRWRQVFVEATNPRFLPSGWDIMHSGRREFGDFSVYNPANRSLVTDETVQ